MEKPRVINFKNFRLTIKPGAKPESILVAFDGGLDVDGSGWESSGGDRKKFESDFKFMFNPYDAPSLKKGEYVLHFKIPDKEKKFYDWIDKQKKSFFGIEDDK